MQTLGSHKDTRRPALGGFCVRATHLCERTEWVTYKRGRGQSVPIHTSAHSDLANRYANMDFIVFSGLISTIIRQIVFSYDIVCQWSKNLPKRLPRLPGSMHLNSEQLAGARYVIPKFHIYAHGLSCQSQFSLNFLPHMARTNGEEPERWWAHINPISMSTKEMGPGARLDTLDDHAAVWNWRKITGMGKSLFYCGTMTS